MKPDARIARKIDCITRSRDGEIAYLGGSDGESGRWKLSSAGLIRAIEKGDITCYVTLDSNSALVTVAVDAASRRSLRSFLGGADSLRRLPECP